MNLPMSTFEQDVDRPLLRYHGGKWSLANWIISHFPAHRIYVEPFGGGGSVLLSKPRSRAEVYNDLDGEMVNLFTVVRDAGNELARAIECTPYSRNEFDLSYEPTAEPIERARRTLVRAQMGFGGNLTRQNQNGKPQRTGFRGYTGEGRSGNYAKEWMGFPTGLMAIVQRLRGVVIENRPAIDVMAAHDGVQTLHYVDPPYVHATRSSFVTGTKRGYRHEMSDDDHRELGAFLKTLRGGCNCQRLSARTLRGAICRLAANRERYARGWRSRPGRGPLDAQRGRRSLAGGAQ